MAHFGCIFCHTRDFFAVQRGACYGNGKYATVCMLVEFRAET